MNFSNEGGGCAGTGYRMFGEMSEFFLHKIRKTTVSPSKLHIFPMFAYFTY